MVKSPASMKAPGHKYDVIGIGACAVDYLAMVDSYPGPDTKNRMKKMLVQGGGLVGTALVALARLGASVSYYAKLGADSLSQSVIEEFDREGVDTSHIIREDGAGPAFAFVLADQSTGQRTIWWTDQHVSPLKGPDVSRDFITSARFLHLDEYWVGEGLLRAAAWAREAGVRIALDLERADNKGVESLIRLTDVLIVPEDFALKFTGAGDAESAAGRLREFGPGIVVVTDGPRGCFCLTAEERFHQPAFEVEVVDTTGCGDVFHGAFIRGLLEDWPLRTVAEFASAVAAMKCRKLGGRTGIPTFKEARDFLLEKGSAQTKELLAQSKCIL